MRKLTLVTGIVSATIYTLYRIGGDKRSQAELTVTPSGTIANPTPRFDAPMFDIGDKVIEYNPYTNGYYVDDDEIPLTHEISDVKFDKGEGVFRYQLKDRDINAWYSEDWLSLPLHTTFIRELSAGSIRVDITEKMADVERKILHKYLDDKARDFTIDTCLDTLIHGNAEERAEAERVLVELSKKEESHE